MTNDDSYWLDGDDEAGTPFVAIADMSRRDRVASTSKRLSQEGLESRKMPIGKPGTILFAMYASVGEAAFLDIEATWNQAILGITPNDENVNSRFLRYILLNMRDDLLREVRTNTQANLNATQVGNIWYGRPPLDEQRAIADYLDRETQKIDELITEQRGLIETLRERRQAVIDQAVNGRLTSRTQDMQKTGIEWLGRVPATWKIEPLWSMFERIKDVGHPDEEMLSVFREFGVVRKNSRENLNVTAENRNIYQLVDDGWFVVNRMKAWQGSVGISTIRGIVSGHYICFKPRHFANSGFLNWLFRSPRYKAGYQSLSRGVRPGQAEIDNDTLRVLPVLVPPVAEQREIAAYLEDQTSRIDELISESEDLIALSQERRAALITAAVTGQIDVRTAA